MAAVAVDLGLPAAVTVSRVLASLVSGLQATGPRVMAVVSLSLAPARRAPPIDRAATLRVD
jgi:hypothetical protein